MSDIQALDRRTAALEALIEIVIGQLDQPTRLRLSAQLALLEAGTHPLQTDPDEDPALAWQVQDRLVGLLAADEG